jgi:GMP synthase (glutamine-hydrolysing)
MRLHAVMHERFENPAAIARWARFRDHDLSCTRLYRNESLPDTGRFDFLLVLGGPQSPATTVFECPYFDARKEIGFIREAISRKKILLGICLGAQLIGEALGARFCHSPEKEVGVFQLKMTGEGKLDPNLKGFPGRFLAAHWHGDMPGMTVHSEILAESEGCPRQIVRYAPKVYGFQCHLELTSGSIERLIQNCPKDLEKGGSSRRVQGAEELRRQDYAAMNELLFTFLDRMVENRG